MQSALPQVFGPEKVHPENLVGRVAVITGGSSGIGYEVSRALAHAGCRVIIVGRSEEHGQTAIAEIRKDSPDADITWKECDMGNLSQIQSVFTDIRESLERLDYLVLSAGMNANQYGLGDDGIERVFAVNYLAQYYAVNQLWPRLRRTSLMPGVSDPRVVAISSQLHQQAPNHVKFDSMDDINNPNLSPVELYGRSKLALNLFIRFGLLEGVIKPTSDAIYALAVHPGAVNTPMQEQWKDAYPGITGHLLSYALKAISRDPEQGSYSTLWALTSSEIDEKHQNGVYFSDPGKRGDESEQASDGKLGAELWKLSEQVIKDKLGDDALTSWETRGAS